MIAISDRHERPERQEEGLDTAAQGPVVGSRIVRAALVVTFANILVKTLGLVRNQVMGGYFGTSDGTVDCFLAAYWVVTSIFYVGEECIGPAMLPIFMARREKDGPARAWRLVSTIFNLQFIALLPIAVCLSAFSAEVMQAAVGWGGKAAEVAKHNMLGMASDFLFWMAPAIFGLSLATVTFITLNAHKKFFWAAFGEGSLRALAIGSIVAFSSQSLLGPWALPAGVLAGSVAKILTHIPGLWSEIRRHYRLKIDLGNPDFKRFLILIAPLLAGSIFAKGRDLFNNVYVISKANDLAGGITLNFFGRNLIETANFLVPYALSVGMFPYLCELADRGEKRGIGNLLQSSSRFMVFIFLPVAAVMVVASKPMTDFLFTFGKLTAQNAKLIGVATACYALAMPFYGVERVMMKGYLCNRRTLSPIVIGIITSTLSMMACWLLVVHLGWKDARVLLVVPLATVGARAVKVLILTFWLRRSIPMFSFGPTAAFLLKVLVLAATCYLASDGAHLAAKSLMPDFTEVAGMKRKLLLAADLAAIGTGATVTFLCVARLLRMEELKDAVDWARPRLSGLISKVREIF
ncbi:MAG: murein biosynthesis integral membrane protein MurJ [Planctomycetota bacterium]|jgi:putative peptidoglycan lipid II flippase